MFTQSYEFTAVQIIQSICVPIVTNSLHVFLLIVRSIYIGPGHAPIRVVIVKDEEF